MSEDSSIDIPAAIWRRRWFIVVLAVVSASAAVGLSMINDPAYRSSAKVWVKPTALNPPGSVNLASTIDLSTEAELADSLTVAEGAAESAGMSANQLVDATSVPVPPAGQVLTIFVQAPTADQARAGAQSMANAYLAFRTQAATEQLASATEAADEQIAGLRSKVAANSAALRKAEPGTPAFIAMQNQLAQLNGQIAIWENSASLLNVAAVDAGEIITPATAPSKPASPDPLRDAMQGAVVGLLLGVAAALALESTRRVRKRTASQSAEQAPASEPHPEPVEATQA